MDVLQTQWKPITYFLIMFSIKVIFMYDLQLGIFAFVSLLMTLLGVYVWEKFTRLQEMFSPNMNMVLYIMVQLILNLSVYTIIYETFCGTFLFMDELSRRFHPLN